LNPALQGRFAVALRDSFSYDPSGVPADNLIEGVPAVYRPAASQRPNTCAPKFCIDNGCTQKYYLNVTIEWNEEKNRWLILNRNVSFEEVSELFIADEYLDVIEHPNTEKYPNQKIILFIKNEQIYCAPFVETEDGIFLKTIFPDRKRTKLYRRGG